MVKAQNRSIGLVLISMDFLIYCSNNDKHLLEEYAFMTTTIFFFEQVKII